MCYLIPTYNLLHVVATAWVLGDRDFIHNSSYMLGCMYPLASRSPCIAHFCCPLGSPIFASWSWGVGWCIAGPAWWCFIWRERISQGTGNIASQKLIVSGNWTHVPHFNAGILVSNFLFHHGRVRTSKLCNIAKASLDKQQVTPEAPYPPQAGHLLQILRTLFHSMKMRCEQMNRPFWHFLRRYLFLCHL